MQTAKATEGREARIARYATRLVDNADDIHFKRISWDEFRRRNRQIHDEIAAEGDGMDRAVMDRIYRPRMED